ncbi:MAG: carbohydrate-binding domain-containing protein [Clostridiaceae bacterium]
MGRKKSLSTALAALLLAAALSSCACAAGCACMGGEGAGISPAPYATAAPKGLAALAAAPSRSDLNTGFSPSDTHILLNGDSVSVKGPGARIDGAVVTIEAGGTYVVSGTLFNGQIAVAADKNAKVHLVLNGASITNKTGAAVYASQCDKLVVTLASGTENALTDGGADYTYFIKAEEEPNAALFCKDDLTINGEGKLAVTAGFKNGVATKDDLLIVGGDISVNAADHALYGKDSMAVLGGTLRLAAGGDGIKTNTADDPALGWVLLSGGDIAIEAARDGVQADTALEITGGDVTVRAGGGADEAVSDEAAFKGLKSGGSLSITGGSVAVESSDDCLHASGDMLLAGGSSTLSSAKKAASCGGTLYVSGGGIKVKRSAEGLEGASVEIGGGNLEIASGDDAINAAGGVSEGGEALPCHVKISGGDIRFLAGGDGVDSNGDIFLSGGALYGFIASTPDNGAIDCDGAFTVSGGVLVCGGTGAGKTPAGSPAQSYVHFAGTLASGVEVKVQTNGAAVCAVTLPVECAYLLISAPGIEAGGRYELYAGTTLLGKVAAGAAGEFLGGEGKKN